MLITLLLTLLNGLMNCSDVEMVQQEKIILVLVAQRPLKHSNVQQGNMSQQSEFYLYENYTNYVNLLGEGYSYMMVPYCVSDEEFNKLLSISSGALLPGGSDDFYFKNETGQSDINKPTQLLHKVELIYQHATKKENVDEGFAVYGICLGMELFLVASFRQRNSGKSIEETTKKAFEKYQGHMKNPKYNVFQKDQQLQQNPQKSLKQNKLLQSQILQDIKHRINISDKITLIKQNIENNNNSLKRISFFLEFLKILEQKSEEEQKVFYFFHQKGVSIKRLDALKLDNFLPIATYQSNKKSYLAMATMKSLKDENNKSYQPLVLLTQFHGEKPLFEKNENVKVAKDDDFAHILNSQLIEIFRKEPRQEKYVTQEENERIKQIAKLMNSSFYMKTPIKSKLHGPAYVLMEDQWKINLEQIKTLMNNNFYSQQSNLRTSIQQPHEIIISAF